MLKEEAVEEQKKLIESMLPWSIRFLKNTRRAYLVIGGGWFLVFLLLRWVAIAHFNRIFIFKDLLQLIVSSGTIISAIMLAFALVVENRLTFDKYFTKFEKTKPDLYQKFKDSIGAKTPEELRDAFEAEFQTALESSLTNSRKENLVVFVIFSTMLGLIQIFLGLVPSPAE